ncbi:MAG: phosphatidate cytidylyltransferase [Bacteroidota bacterium]|nr:phosphatidate cytidylyltransferase [Bacteroidota bacterium]
MKSVGDLLLRSISGLVFIAILISASLFGIWAMILVLFPVLIIGIAEAIPLFWADKQDHNTKYWIIAAAIAYAITYLGIPYLQKLTIAVAVATFLIFAGIILISSANKRADFYQMIATLYVLNGILCLVWMPRIVQVLQQSNVNQIGDYSYQHKYVYLSFFILQWSGDTFAYVVGRLFGKHPLAPKISPKKTWEGTIGGSIFLVTASLLLVYQFHIIPLYLAVVISISTMFLGVLGDLFQSKLKRQVGVKDSGNIIPGHGGILDRFDSVLFSAPGVLYLGLIAIIILQLF